MFPLAEEVPYSAVLVAGAVLDTNGGPVIDADARVLTTAGGPIGGLYGAGNCIASPSANAYWAGGCTIGLAITFGFIAGENAAKEADRLSGSTSIELVEGAAAIPV
jgi:succinate dehydrogenase/fumarate reductase flavoprotein subunit